MNTLAPEMQQKLKQEKVYHSFSQHCVSDGRRLLWNVQISTRIQNELYLRKHPEVKDILQYVMNQILLVHPADVVRATVGKPRISQKYVKVLAISIIGDILSDTDLKPKVHAHKDSLSKLGQLD